MSSDSRSEATWRGFFLAAVIAGVSAVVGMITGFVLGSLADAGVLVAAGHEHLHYGYVLAEIGAYVGLFVGIVVGIGPSASRRATQKTVGSSAERIGSPSSRSDVHPAHAIEQVRQDSERDRTRDDRGDLGSAAAA